MKYLGKILRSKSFIIAVAAILVYTLTGFLLAPYLTRHYLPKVVQEKLKKKAQIGEVRFNPYIFTFEANDFRMTEPDGRPIARLKRLFIDFEMKSLFKWAWTFRQVSLEGLGVNAVIEKDGSLNLASLAPPSEGSPPQQKKEHPPRFIFEDIRLEQGQIDLADRRQSEPAAISIKPLNIEMKNLTTLSGEEGVKTITATSAGGETFKWDGKLSLNPVAAKGNLSVENMKISTLSEFTRDALNLEQPQGKFTVTADYDVDLGSEKPQVLISNLSVALTGIALKLAGAETPFLELPDTLISGGRFDLSRRQLDVGSLAVKGGRARLAMNEDGMLNVQQIARSPGMKTPTDTPSVQDKEMKPWKIMVNNVDLGGFGVDYRDVSRTPGLSAGVDQLKVALKAEVEAGSRTRALLSDVAVGVEGTRAGFIDSAEPAIRIDRVGVDGGSFDLAENRLTVETVSIDGGSADVRRQGDGNLNLMLLFGKPEKKGEAVAEKSDETSDKGQPFSFLVRSVSLSGLRVAFSDLSVRENTPVLNLDDVSAKVSDVDGRSPMKFDLGIKVREGGRITCSGTADPSAQSVETKVQVSELDLTPFQPYIDKAAAVILKSGLFSTQGTLSHGIKAAGARTVYQGGFNVEKLRVTETGGDETLVGWKSVMSEQLKLQLEPNGIDVGDVRLSQPSGKIIIEKDTTLNLAKVIKTDAEPKREEVRMTASTAVPFPYRVRRVLISGGRVDFADLSLPIPFGTRVHDLKGSLAGISSTRNGRAQVKLDGRVDDYGTAKVDGELNTSDPKAFTNIGVIFRNVEMSRLTPYSGKFAGRRIDSGKLSVDLKYKIDNAALAGENQIVVERLKLGEKVESPDAVNLPLDLAVALLEDSNGVIDLGLPVRGNLDSPEFSYGALIGKAILNLLTKIVTSPFRALAALIPGAGEESFKKVDFEPGSAEVVPPEKEKLARLATALQKRPQLKLSVEGRYNPETDRAVLRTAGLRRALATRLGQKPESDVGSDPVDYGSPETGKALEVMFSDRFGADALKTLKAELKAIEKVRKEEAVKNKAVAEEAEGPILLA
ncbi:MAG: hypothetical protein CVU64_07105, partial [Deltaproteobacteria bacterium HGW-Deltaproteobacteria-21]